MKSLTEANAWTAGQCGVIIDSTGCGFTYEDGWFNHDWDIKYTDCREIIRWRFKITTRVSDTCKCYYNTAEVYGTRIHTLEGKTIHEAEIAAITAIYETDKEHEASAKNDENDLRTM